MQVTVEKASICSLNKLDEIEKKCFQDDALEKQQLAHLITASNIRFLVCRVGREIAGFIAGKINLKPESKEGHILTIDVSPEYRHKGIALKLLMKIEEIFKEEGVEMCILEVREGNIPALNLYKKAGYRRTRILKKYYGDVDGILLQKNLTQYDQ